MSQKDTADWAEDLLRRCQAAGFPLAGLLDLDRADEVSPGFSDHFARYEAWIRDGNHAEMKYLERGLERRRDPKILFPEARSILCLAIPYRREMPVSNQQPRYARYLQGEDYHQKLPRMLEPVLQSWKSEGGPSLTDARWKICVDTSALLERSWASLAGLGWIGKNTLLIHPQYGSYLFLAFALLNLESGRGPIPLKNYCGHCSRCLDACPTDALVESGQLDSRKCIAYLTLEKRGPITDEGAQKGMGSWVAGCDLCQEVCPYNRKPLRLEETWSLLEENEATRLKGWDELLRESEAEYRIRVSSSSLERVKWRDWQRNLAIALRNQSASNPELMRDFREILEKKVQESMDDPDLHFLWSAFVNSRP